MHLLSWHKLNDKVKLQLRHILPLTFIPGTIFMDRKQVQNIVEKYSKESTLLFGSLFEEWIPGLENCEQFRPLGYDILREYLKEEENNKRLALIRHMFCHTKYIIRELKPDKVIWVNGSWFRTLHYQPEFWEAINIEAKIDIISPFSSESSAQKHADILGRKIKKHLEERFANISKKKPSPEEIMDFCKLVSKASWDWTGQTATSIVRDGKILAYAHNKVLPYRSAMLHQGALREKGSAPIGEAQELTQTVHGECAAILKMCAMQQSLEGCDLYTTVFPCPFCAHVIAATPIKNIYYSGEYANEIGYEVLKKVGKKTIRL